MKQITPATQAMRAAGYPTCTSVAVAMRSGRIDAATHRLAARIRQAQGDASRPSYDLVMALARRYGCRAELFYLRDQPGRDTPGKRCIKRSGKRAAALVGSRPKPAKISEEAA